MKEVIYLYKRRHEWGKIDFAGEWMVGEHIEFYENTYVEQEAMMIGKRRGGALNRGITRTSNCQVNSLK